MLTHLRVSQFAIIEQIEISFKTGLNIMSGETGAGKSVLLKSLALLMGEKSDTESVRTGFEQAVIEGSFDLSKRPDIQKRMEDAGIPTDEDTLIVRRLIARGGKGRVYLNGVLSPVNVLRDLVVPLVEVAGHAPLIEMTGQHDNRHLLSKHYHLDLLDQYCGTWKLRDQFCAAYTQIKETQQEIERLETLARDRAQRLDFLTYQQDEIKAFNPRPGEEVELEAEVKRLKFSSRLQEFADNCEQVLYSDDDSVTARLHALVQRGTELAKYDEELPKKLESLQTAKTLINDAVFELREYGRSLDSDPQRLEDLEARLNDFRSLQKKFGSGSEQILQALQAIETEISELANSEAQIGNLKQVVEKLQKEMTVVGRDLSKRRAEGAKLFVSAVNEQLEELNMKGVEFVIHMESTEASTGFDSVEFQTKTSAKDAPKPLAKFASGGELSRILLSVKQVVGESAHPRTYLFDEVDTGVSGPTAEKVGRKLKSIAKGQQVICVTHLPQVAACGDVHFHIEKSTSAEGARMQVVELKKTNRVEEIARLISGEKITDTSRKHAKQLIETMCP